MPGPQPNLSAASVPDGLIYCIFSIKHFADNTPDTHQCVRFNIRRSRPVHHPPAGLMIFLYPKYILFQKLCGVTTCIFLPESPSAAPSVRTVPIDAVRRTNRSDTVHTGRQLLFRTPDKTIRSLLFRINDSVGGTALADSHYLVGRVLHSGATTPVQHPSRESLSQLYGMENWYCSPSTGNVSAEPAGNAAARTRTCPKVVTTHEQLASEV